MRTRREQPAFFLSMQYIIGSVSDGIRKQRIEVRFGAINVWQNAQQLCGAGIHIFNNDTSGDFRSTRIDGAIPMWAV